MATKIAKAYVQLEPTTQGFKSKITSALGGDASNAGNEIGESFGAGMVGKIKGIIAAAGIAEVVKSALDAGGALQQSFGGLDTLYGDASQMAKDYASQAVSAGISMNDYAEQAVSFGAALKSAFGGDVTAAAEAANTAIMDMADNSAKMGTDIGAVQSAYQGFAKQNYTMLDNLKLGYGGTKTEMQRLLADAEKLSGVHYNLDNLGDVYSAIHVIQEDLGLTGVAAEEAEGTFTGSFQAMKASAENLMAAITSGNFDNIFDYIQQLIDSTENFVFKNLAPMLGRIVQRLPQLLANLIGEVGYLLQDASKSISKGKFVTDFIADLVSRFFQTVPDLLAGIIQFASAVFEGLIGFDWFSYIGELAHEMIKQFNIGLSDYGVEGQTGLLDTILSWFETMFPHVLKQGATLVLNLVNGIIENLPQFVEAVAPMIASFIAEIGTRLPEIIQTGYEILGKLIAGLIRAIPGLLVAVVKIMVSIVKAFSEYNWKEIGKNIMEGIKNGIISALKSVIAAAKDAAKAIFDAVHDFFEIGSPSKLMNREIGRWIPAGVAVGIEGNINEVTKAVSDMNNATLKAVTSDLNVNTKYSAVNDPTNGLSNLADAMSNNRTSVTVKLEGDAKKLFKVTQEQANIYKRATGQLAFS